MCFERITTGDLLKSDLNFQKHFSYKLDPLYMEFQKIHHNTKFSNYSFIIKNREDIIIPLTKNIKMNSLSFYGDPIEFFSNSKISYSNYQKIKNFFDKSNDKKLFKLEIKNEESIIKIDLNKVEQIIKEIYIDLSQDLKTIKSKFSSNLRNELKKEYEDVKYEVIDKTNYKDNLIFEMMLHHIKIANRKTMSIDLWKKKEEMIMNNKGFLIKVTYKKKLISYSFFFHNNFTCVYFSSAGDRDYYKIIRNMHHRSLWIAIKYAKNYCKFFFIGRNTLHSEKIISDKEKSIEKFKSKFKGIDTKFLILSSFPDYDFYEEICL